MPLHHVDCACNNRSEHNDEECSGTVANPRVGVIGFVDDAWIRLARSFPVNKEKGVTESDGGLNEGDDAAPAN